MTRAAITEMHRQVGDLVFDHNGLAKCGVLVRHLVMPGHLQEARDILTWLHSLSPDMYVSILIAYIHYAAVLCVCRYVNVMEQYRPTFKVGEGEQRARGGFTKYEDIDRHVELSEVEQVRQHARDLGLWRLEDMELLCKPLTDF